MSPYLLFSKMLCSCFLLLFLMSYCYGEDEGARPARKVFPNLRGQSAFEKSFKAIVLLNQMELFFKLDTIKTELGSKMDMQMDRIETAINKTWTIINEDECEAGTHYCSDGAACTDQLILYTCVCLPGYIGDGFTCTDIDECDDARCGVNMICTNHPGSYECQCQEGYEVGVNGCQDIDECQGGQHQCQSPKICINTDGSYECQCQEGYEVGVNGCQDIDECQGGQHQCQFPKTCINTDGSYECQCIPPYIRNGESCKLDCESPSLGMRDLGCIHLVHTKMNWYEAKAECKRLGMRLLEDLKVEHLKPLARHFNPLRSYTGHAWIGFQNKVWLSSGHSVASELVAPNEGELDGDCGTFYMIDGNNFGMFDVSCTNTFDALCQTIP